ncbi:DUF1189 family protein [Aerococcaceae bacterium DSM 111021]|nr:DUF1189 family protein [Aerococcaceae bacterium DSM 111021]
MKKIFNLLKLGLKNPRYYIESINVPWKYIHLVAFGSILVMTLALFINIIPTFSRISQDFSNAVEYIPEYTLSEGTLNIADGEKPLYYQSDSVQIVIDDSINSEMGFESEISEKQRTMLEPNAPFGIFIIEDYAFLTVGETVQEIPGYDYLFANQHRFELFLNYIAEESFSMNAMVFFIILVSSFFVYWFQILLISIMAGFFNVRLTRTIDFKSRIKLTVVISFIPILLLEAMSIIIPGFVATQFTLATITLFLLYLAFKNHTKFIHTIMNNLDQIDTADMEQKEKDEDNEESDKKSDNTDK